MAFAHGSNDAQKSMGVITMALASYAALGSAGAAAKMEVPIWVIVACTRGDGSGHGVELAHHAGQLGHRIIRLRPLGGFARRKRRPPP